MQLSIRSILTVTILVALLCILPTRHRSLVLFAVAVTSLFGAFIFYLRRRDWSSATLVVATALAVYVMAIGPMSAARFYYENHPGLSSPTFDKTLVALSYPPMVLTEAVGLGWYRSWYVLQWCSYVWPEDNDH